MQKLPWDWENEECIRAFAHAVLSGGSALEIAETLNIRFYSERSMSGFITKNMIISASERQNIQGAIRELLPSIASRVIKRLPTRKKVRYVSGKRKPKPPASLPPNPPPVASPRKPEMPPAPRRASPEPPVQVVAPQRGLAVTLSALEAKQCHFPLGDPKDAAFRYCGADVTYRSYCALHTRVLYPSLVVGKKKTAK